MAPLALQIAVCLAFLGAVDDQWTTVIGTFWQRRLILDKDYHRVIEVRSLPSYM